jgi:CBS domain containing-hemolysin-like protein
VRKLGRSRPHRSDSVPLLHTLKELRRTPSHLAIVTDEYGG